MVARSSTIARLNTVTSIICTYPRLQRMVTKPEAVPDMEKGMDADGTIPMKTVMKKVQEWSVINNKKPLWLRAPRDCSESEYSEFYKQTFNAYDEPAAHAHFSVEGNVDFKVTS